MLHSGGALSFARTTQLTKNLPYRSILGVSYGPRPYEGRIAVTERVFLSAAGASPRPTVGMPKVFCLFLSAVITFASPLRGGKGGVFVNTKMQRRCGFHIRILLHRLWRSPSRCGSVTLGRFSLYHIGEEWNASENMVVACRSIAPSFNSLFSLLLG